MHPSDTSRPSGPPGPPEPPEPPRPSPLREALSFLTPVPGAGTRRPTPRALRWFPLVGATLGAALGGLWWAAARMWPLPVAAVIVVGADLALTGMLHLDGLADSADGLLPHLDRQRRLHVMHEPTVGAFAIGTVVLVLGSRWVAFATLRPTAWTILLVAALWCASRTSMAATVGRLPYARPESGPDAGLASAFIGSPLPSWAAALVLALAVTAAGLWSLPAGPVSVVSGLLAFAAVLLLSQRRLGGFTGDVLGAAGIVGETVGILVATARW